jgi:hypothetical protein
MTRLFHGGLLALTFVLLLTGVGPAAAQTSTTIPAADAAKFIGTWTLSFEGGPQGAFTVNASVKAENGQAAAEITSDFDPSPIKVRELAKAGDGLVLKYVAGPQGDFAIKLTLTPDGDDKVKGALEVGDGQFSMTGTGVKKK